MDGTVLPECAGIGEARLTHDTPERFDTGMDPAVHREGLLVPKASIADATDVRPFTGVAAHVDTQMAELDERFPTQLATVRPRPAVDAGMLRETVEFGEYFATFPARIRHPERVRVFVALQRIPGTVHGATVATLEALPPIRQRSTVLLLLLTLVALN